MTQKTAWVLIEHKKGEPSKIIAKLSTKERIEHIQRIFYYDKPKAITTEIIQVTTSN